MTYTERLETLNAAIAETPYAWLASTIDADAAGWTIRYDELLDILEHQTDLGPYALYINAEPLAIDASDELQRALLRHGILSAGTRDSDHLAISTEHRA